MDITDTKFLQYFELPDLPDDIYDELVLIGDNMYQYLLEANFSDTQIMDKELWHEKQPVHNQTSAKYDWSLNDSATCKPGTRLWDIRHPIEELVKPFDVSAHLISPVVQVNMNQATEKFATTAAHTDVERQASINYLITKGGEDIVTHWYNVVQDKPVDYPHCYPADELIGPVHEERIDLRRWHYFNAGMPHSIHNIENYRVMLGIQTKCTHQELLSRLPLV